MVVVVWVVVVKWPSLVLQAFCVPASPCDTHWLSGVGRCFCTPLTPRTSPSPPLSLTVSLSQSLQVSVVESEAYVFDEEVLKKAAELGKPGLVDIKQLQDKFIFRLEGTGVLPVSLADCV